jgi:hypothetical protein
VVAVVEVGVLVGVVVKAVVVVVEDAPLVVVVVPTRGSDVVVVGRGWVPFGADCLTVALATSVLSPGPETSTASADTSALATGKKCRFNVALSLPSEQGKLSGAKLVPPWL